ncbi:MAG TPA: hypothetical protein VGC37_16620 [Friedmanniella sp.]
MTLWEVQRNRWWPTTPVLYAVGGTALTALLAATTRLDPWSLLAMLFVPYGLSTVTASRARVRLTPEGLEVRGLRTRLLRYTDITAVEIAPEWDGARAIWIRLRSSVPQAEPEVVAPPPEWWREPGRSLADVVTAIRVRVDAANAPGPDADGGV